MGDEVFDEVLKMYRDIKRVRERLESISGLELGDDVKVILKKVRDENRKIYNTLKEVLNYDRPKKENKGDEKVE